MILKKITPILFLAISIASCSILKAQNSVNLSLHQDMKLLFGVMNLVTEQEL